MLFANTYWKGHALIYLLVIWDCMGSVVQTIIHGAIATSVYKW